MKMEERGRDRSVQRGGRHAKFSDKRNRAFRSVELEFYGVIIAIIINIETNRDRKNPNPEIHSNGRLRERTKNLIKVAERLYIEN